MGNALVLNASFEPLNFVSWQKAIQLLFQGKAEVVEESDLIVRTVRLSMKVPAVLRLLTFIPLTRKRNIIRFSRENIFLRDNFRCQYCRKRHSRNQLTLDHVVPVVQGGRKVWDNIVTSCKPCNQRKGGRTPQEAGIKLMKPPAQPTWLPKTMVQFGAKHSPELIRKFIKYFSDQLDPDSETELVFSEE